MEITSKMHPSKYPLNPLLMLVNPTLKDLVFKKLGITNPLTSLFTLLIKTDIPELKEVILSLLKSKVPKIVPLMLKTMETVLIP